MTPIIISALALLVSVATAWFTLFRRGKIGMTQPVLLGFLYDLPDGEPKVFFRSMLYATGKRGHILESMFLKIRRGDFTETFPFWMYGETKALLIGSGLRVSEDGVSSNHHFLPAKGESSFEFLAGDYVIGIYAKVVNLSAPILLSTAKVSLSREHAAALSDRTKGVIYTWGPDSQKYHSHVSHAPASALPPQQAAATSRGT